MSNVNAQIQYHYDAASNLALVKVEFMARKILREHPVLKEFVMAMGAVTFVSTQPGRGQAEMSIGLEERSYMRPLKDFIDEWDNILHLTGVPMRFTADGPKVTDW